MILQKPGIGTTAHTNPTKLEICIQQTAPISDSDIDMQEHFPASVYSVTSTSTESSQVASTALSALSSMAKKKVYGPAGR